MYQYNCFVKNSACVMFARRLKVYFVEYYTFSFHLLIILIDIEQFEQFAGFS